MRTASGRGWHWPKLTGPDDWPLAAKITALSVGACAVVVVALTSLGYLRASEGLEAQADRAMESDALLVTQALDSWNNARLTDLQVIAANSSVQRFLDQPSDQRAALAPAVQDVLDSQAKFSQDVDSIAVLDADGTIIASSNPVDVGQRVAQRDYFHVAMGGNTFITGVSVSTITDAPSIFHSAPVKAADGRVLGVVRSRAKLTQVQSDVRAAGGRLGAGATGVLLDESGLVIASSMSTGWFLHPIVPLSDDALQSMIQDKRWGNNDPPPPLGLQGLTRAVGVRGRVPFDWQTDDTDFHAIALSMQATRWSYVAALPVATIDAPAQDFLRNACLAGITLLLLVVILTSLVARGITRRVRRVTAAAQHVAQVDLPALVSVARALASGDLTQKPTMTAGRVPVAGTDEIGNLGSAFNQMIDELKATEEAFAETSSNLRGLVGRIQDSAVQLAGTAERLEGSTRETSTTVDQVARAVQQVASGAQDQAAGAHDSHHAVTQLLEVIDQVARGAQDQAVSVAAASRNAEQMASAAQQAAVSAEGVVATSHQSHATAEQGARAIQATLEGMAQICDVVLHATGRVEELGQLGERIGGVVEIINDIAERTNMLALNAAIEAARAGEHGRGFAVVAEEVKNLAERSQNETRTIAQLVREVQLGTREAVQAMEQGSQLGVRGAGQADEAGRALGEILRAAEQAAQQVGEIAGTAQELAAYSRELSAAIGRISAVVDEASAATEEMTASAESAGHAISGIAAVAEQHSAVAEEVSASAMDVSQQVGQMSAQAGELAATAEHLRGLVAGFKLDAAPTRSPASTIQPSPRRSLASANPAPRPSADPEPNPSAPPAPRPPAHPEPHQSAHPEPHQPLHPEPRPPAHPEPVEG